MEKIKTYLNNNIKCILFELDPQNSDYQLTKEGKVWYVDNGLKKEGIIMNTDVDGDSVEYVGISDGIDESKLESLLKSKDMDGQKVWYDYQKSVFNPELRVNDSYKTFLDKNGIVWPDNWGLVTIIRGDKNESILNEDEGGAACATQGSVGGMGDVVSAQPGAIPGMTGTTGSGDIGFPFPFVGGRTWSGSSPSMLGGKKRKKGKRGGIKIEKPVQKKVMSFNDFYKSSVNDVTHVKESNAFKTILFTIPFLISLNILKAQSVHKKGVDSIFTKLPATEIEFLNNKYTEFKQKTITLSSEDKKMIDDIKITVSNIIKKDFPYFTAIVPLTDKLDAITNVDPFTGKSFGIRKRF